VEPAALGVLPDPQLGGGRPVGDVEAHRLLASQLDASDTGDTADTGVVGQHDVDGGVETAQLGHEPGGGGGEPAHGRQRCQLGGREGDPHGPILVHARRRRAGTA